MIADTTLARIDAALLDHDTTAAQAWVQERIEREVTEGRTRGRDLYSRNIFTLKSEPWQVNPTATARVWDRVNGSYAYRADIDHDPLSTWAHLDPWGNEREAVA